jgi:hypothetical protein
MAELTFKGGKTKIVEYNVAAKVFQYQHGNELTIDKEERSEIAELAKKTVAIDFKKI